VSTALDPLLARADIWRGQRAHALQPVLASGHAALDAVLPGGGWPLGVLVEVCSAHVGLGEASLLLPALGALTRERRWVAWVDPPGVLNAPALVEAGVDPARCVVVEPSHAADVTAASTRRPGAASTRRDDAARSADAAQRNPGAAAARRAQAQPTLWSAEQLMRGGACAAVLAWWNDDDLHGLRRLQLAAESGGALCVLFRPLAHAARISPAALRLRVGAGGALEVFKCRGTAWHDGRGATLRWKLATPRWRPAPTR
jgi:hypothetical protein